MSATSIALTLVFVLSVAAISWAISRGPIRGWSGIAGRAAVGVAVGVVVGELAAVVLFSGSIDRLLDERAARSADATPVVAQASAELDRTRQERTALDTAVDDASRRRDDALVVARCEFHPSPPCPQTAHHRRARRRARNTNGDGLSRRRAATARHRRGQPRPPGAGARLRDRRARADAGADTRRCTEGRRRWPRRALARR